MIGESKSSNNIENCSHRMLIHASSSPELLIPYMPPAFQSFNSYCYHHVNLGITRLRTMVIGSYVKFRLSHNTKVLFVYEKLNNFEVMVESNIPFKWYLTS